MEQIPVPVELLSGDEIPAREVIAVDTAFVILAGVRTYGELTWIGCLRRAVGYAECRVTQREVKQKTHEVLLDLQELGLIKIHYKLGSGVDMATGKPRKDVVSISNALKRYTRVYTNKGEKEYDGPHAAPGARGSGASR